MKKPETLSPKVKDILKILGTGALVSSLFLFPGAGLGIAAIYNFYERISKMNEDKGFKDWEKYNLSRFRYSLQRLHRSKIITISEENGSSLIRLTEKGKVRYLKYKLEEMSLTKPKKWDRKWRLIIYDIAKFNKPAQEAFRRMLKKLKILPLQKSVYLTPYPCENEIEFLREYFGIGNNVMYFALTS